MKSRSVTFLSGLLVGVLGTLAINFLISKMPYGTRPPPGPSVKKYGHPKFIFYRVNGMYIFQPTAAKTKVTGFLF